MVAPLEKKYSVSCRVRHDHVQETDEHIVKEMTASALPTKRSRWLLHLRKGTGCRVVCGTTMSKRLMSTLRNDGVGFSHDEIKAVAPPEKKHSVSCRVRHDHVQEIDEHIAKEMTASALPTKVVTEGKWYEGTWNDWERQSPWSNQFAQ